MTRRAFALLIPLLLAVLASGFAAAPATARPLAWTEGPCAGTAGVTVVADFTKFDGGTVIRRCDTGSPATAFAALAGVDLAPAHGTGEGESGPYEYLCRIDELPGSADDTCTGFLPDAPYWAFWVPDTADVDWAYAEEGVDTYAPAAGAVLGFSFGAGTDEDPNEMSLNLAEAKDADWTPGT